MGGNQFTSLKTQQIGKNQVTLFPAFLIRTVLLGNQRVKEGKELPIKHPNE